MGRFTATPTRPLAFMATPPWHAAKAPETSPVVMVVSMVIEPWGESKMDGLFHGKSQSKMDDVNWVTYDETETSMRLEVKTLTPGWYTQICSWLMYVDGRLCDTVIW